MISMRHTGIYVDDIILLEKFYTTVFDMIPICTMEPDEGELFDEILGMEDARIMTTKLVTPYGKMKGQGDMLELVKILSEIKVPSMLGDHPVFMTGAGHIAFGVDDIRNVTDRLVSEKGVKKTEIKTMKNGNYCCFCTDPEGNWIELIQRSV